MIVNDISPQMQERYGAWFNGITRFHDGAPAQGAISVRTSAHGVAFHHHAERFPGSPVIFPLGLFERAACTPFHPISLISVKGQRILREMNILRLSLRLRITLHGVESAAVDGQHSSGVYRLCIDQEGGYVEER